MSDSLQRAMVLLGQGRYDLAETELRRQLSAEPDNSWAHAFLSLCLASRDRFEDAEREADEAIRLDPLQSLGFQAKAGALRGRKMFREAEAAARVAIGLDSGDPGAFALLASILFLRRDWTAAREAAEQGLQLDPEHAQCLNLRAMALVNLGEKDQAFQTIDAALERDPEDAWTHANMGWALLHQGDHAKAMEHFREALRLDPTDDWARSGIIESLKSRHLVYRLLLRYYLWIGRQQTRIQWLFVLGLLFGQNLLATLAASVPAVAPYTGLIRVAFLGFILLTWVASPLFNTLLRFNKFGRLALSPEQRVESNWIGGFLFLAAAMLVGSFVAPDPIDGLALAMAVILGLFLFPLMTVFTVGPGRPRLIAGLAAGALGLVGASIFILPFVPAALLPAGADVKDWITSCFSTFSLGCVFSTWLPMLLRTYDRSR